MLSCSVLLMSIGWSFYVLNSAKYQFWWLDAVSLAAALLGTFMLLLAQDRINSNIEATEKLQDKVSSLESQVSLLKCKLDEVENDQNSEEQVRLLRNPFTKV